MIKAVFPYGESGPPRHELSFEIDADVKPVAILRPFLSWSHVTGGGAPAWVGGPPCSVMAGVPPPDCLVLALSNSAGSLTGQALDVTQHTHIHTHRSEKDRGKTKAHKPKKRTETE